MKQPVDIDDFVDQMTDMTLLIIPTVAGCGMVWLWLDDNDVGRCCVLYKWWIYHVIKLCRIE